MAIVTFSERDFLRGIVFQPAWYRVRIIGVGESAAKNGQSTNYPVESEVLFNGDTGATSFQNDEGKTVKFAGAPLEWNFNSKAMGFALGYLKSLNVDVAPGQRIDLNASAGMEIDVFIENDTYENRLVNRVNHKYRSPRADVKAVAA